MSTKDKKNLNKLMSYSEAICAAQAHCLKKFKNCYVMGLGVPDPKGVFGTTKGLQKKFGSSRVFDIPLSENAITGIAIGSAISGMRPILTHQRLDFALLSVEQLVNQAAKWHYMFGGKMSVPLVIRLIIGRGWGQGPQHSQALHAWFAHIPGLKVVMPATPSDAKGMLISAVEDDNPVIFFEHRWLHSLRDKVPVKGYKTPLDKGNILSKGADITLIGLSYMTVECYKASRILLKLGISAEVLDLRSVRPLDKNVILKSVKKTGKVIIVDHANLMFGVSAEISSIISENLKNHLSATPVRIGLPEHPSPTSPRLSRDFYPTSKEIVMKALNLLGIEQFNLSQELFGDRTHLDQPDANFQGPF